MGLNVCSEFCSLCLRCLSAPRPLRREAGLWHFDLFGLYSIRDLRGWADIIGARWRSRITVRSYARLETAASSFGPGRGFGGRRTTIQTTTYRHFEEPVTLIYHLLVPPLLLIAVRLLHPLHYVSIPLSSFRVFWSFGFTSFVHDIYGRRGREGARKERS